ncbi:SDR family oxidoreductase [Aureliella helgolandensis]|uniref:RmlD substrate binding domain protein n=1 Tax=Aureliella helgolandensis TaxID=2527968 RepID=A0A518G6L3_9BACT|nr:SDR family oxidoreductase [Aureliella helgolandensis]QDV24221.1 RmlD substrate binding domain protein [Aureliella helgolandensis]
MKIVVIGGSGLIGKKLIPLLELKGHEVVSASPSAGVNTISGEGLAQAFTKADVVVDVTNAPSWEDTAVLEFFQTSTRNILAAEAVAGVMHHVALSVVGADHMPESGYMRAKVAQENLIKAGDVPYTILRATQFFEFLKAIAGPDEEAVRLSDAPMQPIAAVDVAATLADIVERPPVNGMLEVAGPDSLSIAAFVRKALSASGDTRLVIADPKARYFNAAMDDLGLTPRLPNPRIGSTRFESWAVGSASVR